MVERTSIFAYIYDGEEEVGDVTLFSDGRATVVNYWGGVQMWFDDPKTGHEDARRYIESRLAPEPTYR